MSSKQQPIEKPSTKYTCYPKPEADYQQIIQNPDLFLQKLQSFHLFYGTQFRVPTLGGNELDLHRLFLEVTSRGGIEKVIRDRRWKEVKEAFNFPPSITSGSFVLRKYYLSLLYHFEQLYYFKKEEPCTSTADEVPSGSTPPNTVDDGAASNQLALAVIDNLEDGNLATGTIDAKFDYGYLVTVNLGDEEFKGVLYHTPEEPNAPQYSNVSTVTIHHIHKKHQVAVRDPSRPKRNRSGYTFFFAEQYHRLRPSNHGQERGISKKIGDLWSRLTDAEKQVYQEKGLEDKERYKVEMLQYKLSHNIDPQ